MSDIKVGDKVTWWSKRRQEWQTGTLLQAPVRNHDDWPVSVQPDDTDTYRGIVVMRPDRLTRLTDSDLVAAVRAMPLDDTVREEAIAGLRVPGTFEALTDDYAEVMAMMNNANSLGVIEL